MTDARLPVLWLYGPSGVGKTTVAWKLFTQLSESGIPTGYVDVDQLGMCYAAPTPDDWAPEPASDPGRHRMQARNLDAVVANMEAAGARCLVVSGVVNAVRGIDVDLIPHAALTPCRLRCDPPELRRRLVARGRPGEQIDEMLTDADTFDRTDPTGRCVDTTGRSVADVLRLVREQTGAWPDPTGSAGATVSDTGELSRPYGTPATSPGEILWVRGATAVGKSTVGWQIYHRTRRAGVRSAFVDLDQIGHFRPIRDEDPRHHRLKAGNLAAIWQTYRACGAERLIVVGPVDHPAAIGTHAAALPAATITVCRLHAGRDALTERVMLRGRGQGPDIPGDELTGQPAALLHRVADEATAEAEALDRVALGDLRVDTDGRGVHDIAREILRRTALPDRPDHVAGT